MEITSFLLLPPESILNSWSTPSFESNELNEYLNVVFSNVGEEGGKNIFLYTLVTKMKEYKHSPKGKYLRNLFEKRIASIEKLKDILKDGGLEKTANSIEIQPPNKEGVGKIKYKYCNGEGNFASYVLDT